MKERESPLQIVSIDIFLFTKFADQLPEHMNFSQYIAANVPSLKDFREESTKLQNGISALKALCSAMFSLLRYYISVSFNQLTRKKRAKC